MIQLWPDKEAESIRKEHGEQALYIFETGFGPSGKPHFGTFGEVVRTNYVMLALRDLGYQTKLIAFSDDLDGLRKVPEGFPAWLKEHIGKPVSQIPDPFGTHESFSAHMNALLVEMLNELGLDFEFRSSAVSYREGAFNEQIKMVIEQYEGVQDIIFPYLRDETKETWFPFLPFCENCGRVGTTRVLSVDKSALTLSYACDKEFGGQMGCGHQGTISPLNGTGKLQWKVDWPTRWHAFGVHYEMFGKDLIESAEVGDKIVQRIFRAKPPVHMFYELFLDEWGAKISKSKGRQGIDGQTWLNYGSSESLRYLMLDKPREAKRLFAGVIPRYMDLTTKATEAYYSGEEKLAREARHYQFITLFNPPAEAPFTMDFSTLVNFVGNVGVSDPQIVADYLQRSGMVSPETDSSTLNELITKAIRLYNEQLQYELEAPRFDALEGFLLGLVVAYLEAGDYEADQIHFELFEFTKKYQVEAGKFFRALYLALIRQERGPRAGSFIKLLGQAKAAELIRQRVSESLQVPAEEEATATPLTLPVKIAPEVQSRYPDLHLGMAILEGVKIEKRSSELHHQIEAAIQQVKSIDLDSALQTGSIAAYRAFFQDFGANPNAMPPSPENILRLAVAGRLPNVNNLVDATNLSVLETGLSVAVYDLDKIEGWLSLRFAEPEDRHLPLGAKQYNSVSTGELIYADQNEVICRALNHRDSDKTKIGQKTTRVLLIVDGGPQISVADIYAALALNIERIRHFAGGEVRLQSLLL